MENYSNIRMVKDLWAFIKPYKVKFCIGTLIRITSDVARLFIPWIFGSIITFAATYAPGTDIQPLILLIGSSIVLGLYNNSMRDIAKFFIYPIAEKASIDAHLRSIKHMFSLDTDWHEAENTGNKMKRIETGRDSINRMVRIYVDLFLESSLNVIVISIVFYALSWQLNLMIIFFFITYYTLSLQLTNRAVKQAHVVNVEWEKFEGVSFESINNISTIKALGISRNIMPFLKKNSLKLFHELRTRIKFFRIREGFLNTYQDLFKLSILVFTIWQVFLGNFEVGIIATVLLYFEKIEASAYEFAQITNEFAVAKVGLLRMNQILNQKPLVELTGTKTFKKNWKILALKDVSFAYKSNKVLKNLSLTIKKGEKIGIVGISGTGKSTLFKLLMKLYTNYQGSISFDNTELKDIKRSSYLQDLSVVQQDTELFNLSLKDNIAISRMYPQKIRKKHLSDAMRIAHINDFAHKLNKGIDSLIGEKGIKLSGGERQRVGIARAIYKQPGILLLDEATSHLDAESEQKIKDTLHNFFKNITAIVIAHRLSTIKEMDRIIVMRKGEIIEIGTFESLIKKKGEFYKLWKKQKF